MEQLQPQNGWIPVTERMPEMDGDYIVFCGDGNVECVEYLSPKKDKHPWPAIAGWYGETGQIDNVTHWQPIPPPPSFPPSRSAIIAGESHVDASWMGGIEAVHAQMRQNMVDFTDPDRCEHLPEDW